jgi:hypothetical protein
MYASLMCLNVSVFCWFTFMSMHDSCQDTHVHTCRDHSHTLELRWYECDADSLSLLRQSYIQAYKLVCMCEHIYICSLFPFVSFLYSWWSNSLFLLDTGILNSPGTSCRPCHQTFLPGFQCLGECACFSWF